MPVLQGLIQLVGVNKSSLTLRTAHCNSLYIQAYSTFESMWPTCTDWSCWVSLLFLPEDQRRSPWWLRLDTQSHGGVLLLGKGGEPGTQEHPAPGSSQRGLWGCHTWLSQGPPAMVPASLPPSRFHMSSGHGKTLTCTHMRKEFPDVLPLNAWHCPGVLWGLLCVPCQHLPVLSGDLALCCDGKL